MTVYYNEFDTKSAEWLRQLIKNGMIADGVVDDRSITEVEPIDLKGFSQHHFFAGIGGWSYALRLAGWADDRPVCTASLPCQPFSVAGQQRGKSDERHLLPHFIELVKQCNFKTIFGEQVPGAIKHGWLDDLCLEMERENYAVGAIVLTAAGEGAPHIRQRLYWVADSINKGSQGRLSGWQNQEREAVSGRAGCGGTVRWLSDTENRDGRPESQLTASSGGESRDQFGGDGSCSGLGNTEHQQRERGLSEHREESGENSERAASEFTRPMQAIRLGNTEYNGQLTGTKPGGHATAIHDSEARTHNSSEPTGASTSRTISEWTDPEWLYCRDNKYRPIKPSIKPLVDGIPRGVGYSSYTSESIDADDTQEARVMRLKGYGNAIVPQVAAQFIRAFMELSL